MPRFVAAALFGSMAAALTIPSPAAAQTAVGCAPFCDYRHYYGAYDYTYVQPGLYCYPVCGPDGTCVPAKTCVRSPYVAGTPAGVTFYDPTLANPNAIPQRRLRAAVVRVRPYRPRD